MYVDHDMEESGWTMSQMYTMLFDGIEYTSETSMSYEGGSSCSPPTYLIK